MRVMVLEPPLRMTQVPQRLLYAMDFIAERVEPGVDQYYIRKYRYALPEGISHDIPVTHDDVMILIQEVVANGEASGFY